MEKKMFNYSRHRFLVLILFALNSALFSVPAIAGDFYESQGIAIRGYDLVANFQLNKAVKGSAEFKVEHKGSVFYFSSAAHRDAFVKAPEKYAPQYAGYCAFGMASGYKAATDPNAFTVVDGKLYLNYNADIQKKWGTDVPGYLKKADEKWPAAQSQTKVIE
jgi:YHS domain-containing protein